MITVPFLLGGIMFLAEGLFTAGLGAYLWRRVVRFRKTARRTSAVVVDFQVKQGGCYPIFEFADEAGSSHQVCSGTGYCGTLPYKKGDSVPVLYNPHAPADARIDSFVAMWLGPLACAVVSATSVAVGIVLLFI
jgi:hypothetical protein